MTSTLQPNTTLGAYRIAEPIGAGGMGEVYRARDTKLDRDVAIKVLPEAFAASPERLGRFEREAKLLASLNHPNIAAIHGLEEENGIRFLVLELIPGETLAERLHRGALPVEDALRLAKQVAEALEAAHARGVIHRDLKPANVNVTPEGQVKVLDFGLAKAFDDETAGSDASQSPTLSAGSTRAGVILGTAAYMSPEQARGLAVDKRTDIFSFGSLLYEMLTGRKAFDGDLVSDALASVIKSDPDWDGLPPIVSPRVRELLKRCLEKDPNRRRRDIGDVRIEIETLLSDESDDRSDLEPHHGATPRWRLAALGGTLLLVGLALGYGLSRPPAPDPKPVLRFETFIPEANLDVATRAIALSSDGTRVAYVAGDRRVYVRELQGLQPRAIAELAGVGPILGNPWRVEFSPDGEWLAFWQDGKLQKTAVGSGVSVTLCSLERPPSGLSWTESDTIVYSNRADGIWQVSANGGEPERVVSPEDAPAAYGVEVLPGAKAVLFTTARSLSDMELVVQRIPADDGEPHVLSREGFARYASTGHLVYPKDGTLFAVPFDSERLTLSGAPVPLVDGIAESSIGLVARALFDVSDNGTLVYFPDTGIGSRELRWVDETGEKPVSSKLASYVRPRLSPDGQSVAVEIVGRNGSDVWIHDIERDTQARLTTDGRSGFPIWSPNGQWIAFFRRGEASGIYRRRADLSDDSELLLELDSIFALDDWWSDSDSSWLVYSERDLPHTRIWAFSPHESDAKPRLLVESTFSASTASLSSDGRYFIYHATESGDFQVYASTFPDGAGKVVVTPGYGADAVWSAAGDRIVSMNNILGTFEAIEVSTDPELRVGASRTLFQSRYENPAGRNYDPHPDGKRIVIVSAASTAEQQTMVFVVNWFEELKARVPVQ